MSWSKTIRPSCALVAPALVLAACLTGTPAVAATYTWDASGVGSVLDGSGTWGATNANWWNGADQVWQDSNAAVFGAGGVAGTATVGNIVQPTSITFNPVASGNYLVTGGSISTGSSGSLPLTVNTSASISSQLTGSGALTVNGAAGARLVLAGANTYSGSTALLGGVLTVGSVENAGASGPLGVGGAISLGGGTLQYSAANNFDYSSRFSTAAGRAYNIDTNGRTVTFATALTSSGGSLTLNDTSASPGKLILTGANTYAGGTTITAGTLQIGDGVASNGALAGNVTDNSTLAFANPSALSYPGIISGAGSLAKLGNGALTLTGLSTYSGGTVISGGSLALNGSTGSLKSGSALGFAVGGGTFNYASGATGTSQTLGALTFGGGDSVVQSTYGTSGNTVLTFASAARTSDVGATGNFVASGGANGTTNKFVLSSAPTAGTLIDPGVFFGGGATGAGYATYDAGGFLRAYTATDANAVSQAASTSGMGGISSTSNVFLNGTISGQTTAAINTLIPTGNYNLTLASGATFGVNGILKAGNAAGGTISGGTLQPATAGGDLIVRTDQASDSLAISSVIAPNGANALVKSGAGTVTLSGANNLSGGLFLNGGSFSVSGSGNLGTGTITFNGGALYNTAAMTVPNNVVINGGGCTLYAPANQGNPVTFTGNLSGVGGIAVGLTNASYTSRAIFAGNNSAYSGNITATYYPNTLTFDGPNSTGTGDIYAAESYSSNTFNFLADSSGTCLAADVSAPRSSTLTINVGPITSATNGVITLKSVGANPNTGGQDTYTITGANGYSLSIGTLSVLSRSTCTLNPTTANLAVGTVTGNQALSLNGGAATSNTIRTINSGMGAISIAAGGWTFNGPSAYSSGTTISGGTLTVACTTQSTSASSTGTGNVALNGGELFSVSGGTSYILGNLTCGTAAATTIVPGVGGIGAMSVGGLTLSGSSTLNFAINSGSSYDQILSSGSLGFNGSGAASILVSPTAPSGTYPLIDFGMTTLTNTSQLSLGLIGGGSVPPSFSLALNTTTDQLDLMVASLGNSSKLALSGTSVTLRAMQGNPVYKNINLSETSGGTWQSGFATSLTGSATVSPSSGTLAASGSQPLTLGWTSYATTGPMIGSVIVSNTANNSDPFNGGGNVISMTGAVVANRVVNASSAMNVGMHVNAPAVVTLSTTGADSYFTRVTVGTVTTPDANGFTCVGGTNTVFNSPSATDARLITATRGATLGSTYAGSFTLITSGEGLLGEQPINVTVPYSVQVFSGNANWTGNGGSTAWGADANWSDAQSSATVGAPGLAGSASIGDQANFIGSGGTIALNNVSPHIATVNFNGTAAYTVAQGAGGTGVLHLDNGANGVAVTASNGAANVISAQVSLDSATDVTTVNGNDQLTISGSVTGAGALTKNGSGTLTLSGNNTFSGGVQINAGELQILNTSAALGTGSITFNGGYLYTGSYGLNIPNNIVVNSSGGQLGCNYKGMTLSGNISGNGTLTGNQNLSGWTISGNNGAFSGTIAVPKNNTVTFSGSNSTGTGEVSVNDYYASDAVNLLSDTSATFLAADVSGQGYSSGHGGLTFNVGPITAGNANNTITLKSVGQYSGGSELYDITGAAGYSLAISSLSVLGAGSELYPTTANVNVGTVTGNTLLTLGGTALANTIGAANMGSLSVSSGGWTLNGPSTYYGTTSISGGTLHLGGTQALGSGGLTANGGLLDLNGNSVTVGTFGGAAGIITDLSTGGTTTMLSVNQNANATFGGNIKDGRSNTLALAVNGFMALTLAGSNGYSGGTTVGGGVLVVANGAVGSATGTGPVTLNGGTLAAGPNGGTITGAVIAGSGLHVIAPGAGLASGQYGALNLSGGLTTSSLTTLSFNLGSPLSGGAYTGDLINLSSGSLNASGGGNIAFVTNPTTAGDYRLIQGSNLGTSWNSLVLPTVPGETYDLSTTVDAGYLDLVVLTAGVWKQPVSGSWANGNNWSDGNVPGAGDTVNFSGTPSSPANVTLDGQQAATNMVFNTAGAAGYTISQGTDGLGSGNNLTLGWYGSGGSIAVISGTHSIAAPVVMSANLAVSTTAGGLLEFTGGLNDNTAGYGLTLTGGGELELSGTNDYLGPTIVNGGTMYVTTPIALPDGNNLFVGSGAPFAPIIASEAVSPHSVAAVPEPGTLAILSGLVAGLSSVVVYRRRGRRT